MTYRVTPWLAGSKDIIADDPIDGVGAITESETLGVLYLWEDAKDKIPLAVLNIEAYVRLDFEDEGDFVEFTASPELRMATRG